jgi:hypothetical protein
MPNAREHPVIACVPMPSSAGLVSSVRTEFGVWPILLS